MRRIVFAIALLLATQALPSGQVKTKPWTPPRTPDGHPDLQGIWDYRSATPLQRPARFAGKEFLTPDEVVAYEQEALERPDGRPPDRAVSSSRVVARLREDRGQDPADVADRRSAGRQDSADDA